MRGAVAVMVLLAGVAGVRPASSQVAVDEVPLLREASAREDAGELDGAESLLRRIVEARPASVPALLSLERVLRIQGRLDALPSLVRSALEEEPESALLNQLLLRSLAALDRPGELDAAVRAWIEQSPRLETPYREAARVWREEGEVGRARAVLEEGRDRIDGRDALALELGELYASIGDRDGTLREWDRAIGPEARGLLQVRRHMRGLPDGGASLLRPLVARLADGPRTDARLEAAVEMAVEAGLEERAREIAADLLPARTLEERTLFLSRLARQADGARQHGLAYWAYGELLDLEDRQIRAESRVGGRRGEARAVDGGRDVQETGRGLAIRQRLAELAVIVGDTAGAADRFRAVEQAYEEGSPERRQAAAHRIELSIATDLDQAMGALAGFRTAFPNAPEDDRLAAAVAGALVDRGRREEAERTLAGTRGPRSSMMRGRLALERGDIAAARTAYLAAAPELGGAEATAVLELATLLGRISEEAGAVLGEAMRRRDRGQAGEAVDVLLASVPGLRPEDRPPLLELAAEMAEQGGLEADARDVRRRIVAEHPRSTEAPAALLALARSLRAEAGGSIEARELLERLIVEYPRSALVPQARRALSAPGQGAAAHEERSRR